MTKNQSIKSWDLTAMLIVAALWVMVRR